MSFSQTNLRAAISVSVVLICCFVLTAFVSSAYKRERESLAQIHYQRGQEMAAHGHLQEAVEEYRKALLFTPDRTQYRLSLASALLDDHRLDEAQAHLEQLLEEEPTNGKVNLMLARVAMLRHRTNAAIEYYHRAVYEYWPASESAERRRARWELLGLLAQTGHRNEAIGELMQLYANTPANPAQISKIGFLLLGFGATSEASQVFHDLVRIAPQHADGHRGLAQVDFQAGDYVASRHEYQRALRADSNDRESAQGLALDNAVIDLDPALPGVSLAERLRRSQNLLRRVITDLQPCSPDATDAHVEAAQQLLTAKQPAGADVGFALQQTAAQLWSERPDLCGNRPISDPAVEVVLSRIGHG